MLTEITFPEDLTRPLGLFKATFRDLKQIVVLAGPNGSGKSRYLRLVPEVLRQARMAAQAAHARRAQLKSPLGALAGHGSGHPDAQLAKLDERSRLVSAPDLARPGVPIELNSVDVVSTMKNPDALPPRELRAVPTSLQQAPVSQLHEHLLAYLDTVALALYEEKHPDITHDPEISKAAEGAHQFNRLLEALLGTRVAYRRVQGGMTKATLFDRVVNPGELSAGQKLLISWAMCVHLQHDGRLKGNLLLVDEPEKHLHPEACIRVLERLELAIGDTGQLWIATHSPAVVARFGTGSLYFVEKAQARYAGSAVTAVMNGLLGGEAARQDFAAFLSEADELDFLTFAAQSLICPGVAKHAQGDPQESAFARIASQARQEGRAPRILDYGAGRGRFGAALAETNAASGFDLFAYNDPKHAEHTKECNANMRRLYPDDTASRVSSEISDFWGDKRVDLVVMCNFLHEIAPKDWCYHFAKCAEVLRESGVLLLMEDQRPPIGELPHREGFIVLDHGEVRLLFGRSSDPRKLSTNDRLSAIEVPQGLLRTATGDTVRAALEAVVRRAEREIEHLRLNLDTTSHHQGRQHAYFALLHVNACLALHGFGGRSSDS
jgi:SAM-dependent methyltransferase